ncbi:YfiR family protein [Cognatazoarcus halotolerans]|uniref:YfiR family protein n=1 Tax=Cognatazoarcus halotolerans TaxID=2686016 RepID=UPI00135B1DB0|nr:YfiR family protein [Cognatazoarcus halotolerans]MBX3679170.1 YfiR family protein [Rhodocyclaceae bacterium]MCB1899530.1 YfiR family protein [Rhodocyclaceae bacterium]MCP5311022.1 YfiR family protein [Zoogloeaceae bacterium]
MISIDRLRRALAFLFLAGAFLSGNVALAQSEVSTESRVKAAYVYNFAKYVEWPGVAAQGPLRLCIAGSDSLDRMLEALEGRQAQGRVIQVMKGVPLAQLRHCQMVFVGRGDAALLHDVVQATSGAAVLVVGDADGFIGAGGGIGLVVADDRVRFEVNAEALKLGRLRASAQMLKLARNAAELTVR